MFIDTNMSRHNLYLKYSYKNKQFITSFFDLIYDDLIYL